MTFFGWLGSGFILHSQAAVDIIQNITEKERKETVRRFLLGLFTAVLTLGVLLGVGLVLARKEPKLPAVTVETTVQETEQTLPPETEAEQTVPTETEMPVPEKVTIDTVPLYYQTDYPYIKFGNGTIATSGCSVTCLAMVATYLTDTEYTPVQMAYHFGSYGKNNIERLDHGIARMQLPYQRTEDIQDVLKALNEGKLAILMMDDESVFTNEQHFIVAAGRNPEGKYVINDPLETNYLNADVHVKNAYENGFEDFHLARGFSGGWIFDKADMPEDPFLFDASMPEQQENRYQGYTLTPDDIYTLACFVWAEAREEPVETRQAVAEVVLNRVMSPEYPNTVRDVIRKTEFYRAADAMSRIDEPGLEQYLAVDAAMYGPYILPQDIYFYSAWEKGQDQWGQLGSYTFYKER